MSDVVDAADLFGGAVAFEEWGEMRGGAPSPRTKLQPKPQAHRRKDEGWDLETVRTRLEERLQHINEELQRLESLQSERSKIERLLAAIGD